MLRLSRKHIVLIALAIGAAGVIGVPALRAADGGSADAPAATGSTITGVVRNGATPVAGAEVVLFAPDHGPTTHPAAANTSRLGRILGNSPDGQGKHGHIVARTETDADGKFELTDVPNGRFLLVAHLKGVGRAHQRVVVGRGAVAPIILTLQKEHEEGPTTQPGA